MAPRAAHALEASFWIFTIVCLFLCTLHLPLDARLSKLIWSGTSHWPSRTWTLEVGHLCFFIFFHCRVRCESFTLPRNASFSPLLDSLGALKRLSLRSLLVAQLCECYAQMEKDMYGYARN